MLHLQVLGTLDLRTADGAVVQSLLAHPKTTALLIYLLLAQPRGFHRRDTLCALFWPEADEPHARGSLRQALSRIRRSAGGRIIETRGKEEVRALAGTVRCDALELEEAAEGERHDQVLELFRGPLLPGFHVQDVPTFDHWLSEKRNDLRGLAGDSALARARELISGGHLVEAEPVALRALDLTLANGAVARELMKELAEAGDRVGAVRLYDHWARRLSRELEMEPSVEMQAFARELRVAAGSAPGADEASPTGEPPEVGGVRKSETAAQVGKERQAEEIRRETGARVRPWLAVPLLVLLLTVGLTLFQRPGDFNLSIDRPKLVVLPLKCLSDGQEDVSLASAIYEDLVTQLGRITGLHVIDRTSAEVYRDTGTPIPMIAEELGVKYALSGGVQRAGNRVHLNLRLIDARTDRQIWAQIFDRDGAPEHLPERVLAIQSDIVHSVVSELGVALRREEWDRSARRSTQDADAYRLYSRGIEASQRGHRLQAESLFKQAAERDPGFLAAHYRLVLTSSVLFGFEGLRTAEREERIRKAAERTVEIDPDSPDALLAMGMYLYRVARDWVGSLEWLDRAAETLRGEYLYNFYRALAERRMGQWLRSAASMEAAISLSPGRRSPRKELALTLMYLRRYEAAESSLRQLLEKSPRQDEVFWNYLFFTVWGRGGDLGRLRPKIEAYGGFHCRWRYALAQGDGWGALVALEDAPDVKISGRLWRPRPLLTGIAWEAVGDRKQASVAYEEAATILESVIQGGGGDERHHAALSLAYAGLGRREEAIREARTATELLPLEQDALFGTEYLFTLAAVLARFEEVEESLQILERLLTAPSRCSAPKLRNHYLLRPLWDEPAFLELLEREPGRVF